VRSDVVQCIQNSNDHAGGCRGGDRGAKGKKGWHVSGEGLNQHSKKYLFFSAIGSRSQSLNYMI